MSVVSECIDLEINCDPNHVEEMQAFLPIGEDEERFARPTPRMPS